MSRQRLGPLSSLAHLKRVTAAVEEAGPQPLIRVIAGGSQTEGKVTYFRLRRCWQTQNRKMPYRATRGLRPGGQYNRL